MVFFKKKNNTEVNEEEHADHNLLGNSDIPRLVKDSKVPVIKDHNGNVIFQRDYDNRRVVVSNYVLRALLAEGKLMECIGFFKINNLIDYISLYDQKITNTVTVNFYIKGTDTYFVPFRYNDDEKFIQGDDEVHYTNEALDIDQNRHIDTGYNDPIDTQNIKLCSIKDPKTNEKYLPLFESQDELRSIFKNDEYRICKISYNEATIFANKYLGMVFRPTEESFIISNDIAGFFTAVTHFVKPKIDYRKFTEGQVTIQEKIKKLHSIKINSPKFNEYFKGIIQSIAHLNKIYVALSRNGFNSKTGMSVPLLTNKDGNTSIFIFSDKEIAQKWTQHYGNFSSTGIPLIGEIKCDDNFDSLFAIANKLGIKLCTVDQEASFFIFNIKVLLEISNLNTMIKLKIPKEIADRSTLSDDKKNKIKINFNDVKVIGLNRLQDNTEYTEFEIE